MFECVCGKCFDNDISLSRHKSTCLIYRETLKKKRHRVFREENVDHVICRFCGYKARDIGAHLRYSKAPHPDRKQYRKLFPDARIACEDIETVRKKTCKRVHGDPNYRNADLQSMSVKKAFSNPELIERIKKTKMERYGNSGYVNIEARKKTLMQKYGVDNPMKCPEIARKTSETMKKLYGNISR